MKRHPYLIALAISLVIAAAVFLAACDTAPPLTGRVTEMEIEKSIKTGAVKCYEIEITDDQGKETDICVGRTVYDRYQVGDRYPKK